MSLPTCSITFAKFKVKCPIDFFKVESDGGSGASSQSGDSSAAEEDKKDSSSAPPAGQNKVQVTPVSFPTSKKHAFNGDTRGVRSNYIPPQPRQTPYRGAQNSGIDWNYFSQRSGSGGSRGGGGHGGSRGGGGHGGSRGGGGRGGGGGGGHGGRGGGGGHGGHGGRGGGGHGGRGGGGGHGGRGGVSGGGKLGASNLNTKVNNMARNARSTGGVGGGAGRATAARAISTAKSISAGHVANIGHAASSSTALNRRAISGGISKIKLAANPKTNPAKSANLKLAKKDKIPCIMNTDICIREIVEFRNIDYVAFKHFNKFRDQMTELLKLYQSEYAFSVFPSKLSNQFLNSKLILI